MGKVYKYWADYPKSAWRWKNFSRREVACRCGELKVDEASMNKLQALREKLGRPIHVNSAYRSPAYNRRVGGVSNSQHLKAKAFDISMRNQNVAKFVKEAKALGFNAIGYYPKHNFIHIDTRSRRATWGKKFT